MTRLWLVGPMTILLALAGCTASGAPTAPTIRPITVTEAPQTVSVTREVRVPLPRRDISGPLTSIHRFITGAIWGGGDIPNAAADVNGRLTYTELVGSAVYSNTMNVNAQGVGYTSTLTLAVRATSSDPRTVVDVLHRPSNGEYDYLLTGDAFRPVPPTPWVVVPAEFGTGVGCGIPGRAAVCEVTADLLDNQHLTPQLPTNTVTDAHLTGTVRSAITLRQLLTLKTFRLQKAAATLIHKAGKTALDRTLIPVTMTYYSGTGVTHGRPNSLSINGRVTVAGIAVAINLLWKEGLYSTSGNLSVPVPTIALYTLLTPAAVRVLTRKRNASE